MSATLKAADLPAGTIVSLLADDFDRIVGMLVHEDNEEEPGVTNPYIVILAGTRTETGKKYPIGHRLVASWMNFWHSRRPTPDGYYTVVYIPERHDD